MRPCLPSTAGFTPSHCISNWGRRFFFNKIIVRVVPQLECVFSRCHWGRVSTVAVNLFVYILTAGSHCVTMWLVLSDTGEKKKKENFSRKLLSFRVFSTTFTTYFFPGVLSWRFMSVLFLQCLSSSLNISSLNRNDRLRQQRVSATLKTSVSFSHLCVRRGLVAMCYLSPFSVWNEGCISSHRLSKCLSFSPRVSSN